MKKREKLILWIWNVFIIVAVFSYFSLVIIHMTIDPVPEQGHIRVHDRYLRTTTDSTWYDTWWNWFGLSLIWHIRGLPPSPCKKWHNDKSSNQGESDKKKTSFIWEDCMKKDVNFPIIYYFFFTFDLPKYQLISLLLQKSYLSRKSMQYYCSKSWWQYNQFIHHSIQNLKLIIRAKILLYILIFFIAMLVFLQNPFSKWLTPVIRVWNISF